MVLSHIIFSGSLKCLFVFLTLFFSTIFECLNKKIHYMCTSNKIDLLT